MKTCSVAGCDLKHKAKGYCAKHRNRVRKGLSLDLSVDLRVVRLSGKSNMNWNGGTNDKYPQSYLKKKNSLILRIENPQCEICGEPAVQAHHRDGKRTNHNLNNLQALCRTCHAQEHIKLRKHLTNTKIYDTPKPRQHLEV
jgi:5-methylcytosine-specific restriction endonuclease McrA